MNEQDETPRSVPRALKGLVFGMGIVLVCSVIALGLAMTSRLGKTPIKNTGCEATTVHTKGAPYTVLHTDGKTLSLLIEHRAYKEVRTVDSCTGASLNSVEIR